MSPVNSGEHEMLGSEGPSSRMSGSDAEERRLGPEIIEFAVVPIELYDNDIVSSRQQRFDSLVRTSRAWHHENPLMSLNDEIDFDLLKTLGSSTQDYGYYRHARELPAIGEEEAGYAEHVLFFNTDACRLYLRRRPISALAHSSHASADASRARELVLATELFAWMRGCYSEVDSLIDFREDEAAAALFDPSHNESRRSQIEDLVASDRSLLYSAPFLVVDLRDSETDISTSVMSFRSVLDDLWILQEAGYVSSLSPRMIAKVIRSIESEHIGSSIGRLVDELRIYGDSGRFRSHPRSSKNELTNLVLDNLGGLDPLEIRTALEVALVSAGLQRDERGRTWTEIDHTGTPAWLTVDWETSIFAATNLDQIRSFVALQIAVEGVWNYLDLAARNLPVIISDRRRDIDGNRSLRALSSQALRAAGWRTRLSGWRRVLLEELRSTYRIDDNIGVFFRTSEEYVRHEEVAREREARTRAQRFQGAVAIGGVALAALVLAELTISIAAANDHTVKSVSEAVGWITFPLVVVVGLWVAAWFFHGDYRPRHQFWAIWLPGLILGVALGWRLSTWQSHATEFGLPLTTIPVPGTGHDISLAWVAWLIGGAFGLVVWWWLAMAAEAARSRISRVLPNRNSTEA